MTEDKEYMLSILDEMLKIHSPLGYHHEIQKYLEKLLSDLGYETKAFNAGGFSVSFGEGEKHVAITAHMDEIGLAIRNIEENGRINLVPIGGIYAQTLNDHNCTVLTLDNKRYSATVRSCSPSVHLSEKEEYTQSFDLAKNMELILDEPVSSKEEILALGINPGDYVLLDPRTVFTENGFIKSRFIDDKACLATIICALKYIKDNNIKLHKRITIQFSAFEELGIGGALGLDNDISQLLAVDIGLVGKNMNASEHKVSIVAMDSRAPYSRNFIKILRTLAIENNIDFSIDVNYPHYGSDTSPALLSGHDVEHGLIGPGTFASHGYERTHIDSLLQTYKLLLAYMTSPYKL